MKILLIQPAKAQKLLVQNMFGFLGQKKGAQLGRTVTTHLF
ncbi:hypothetical protein ANME2D_03205 [Candidatus Methanoperedens nitroreducens]|uniref:Uncharacterized protein n=1 Tax=Candidatus Methanoperedens nitratireducens TaxID=1392998 RepID=A0A062V3H3_9EURY|nr:hypothetical protein ANME2D_03205 [Candidatus Methanoperedens nitroreducens]